MTKQKFIEISHAAQNDAGSLPNFNYKVTKYNNAENTNKADPVAAFLGALIAINDDADKAIDDFDFYFEELSRVKTAFKNQQ